MGDAAEVGSQLEQTVADFFVDSGYGARCNEVLEGRSGGRHEIDVLAEKSDDLTTFRVAVECKAWQQPVEKDVVSKLDYIVRDLGLNKGIVVGLAGFRSGAEQAATELGIELWGPDELRRHLGDEAVGEHQVPPSAVNTTHAWGIPFAVSQGRAQQRILSERTGWLRGRERLVYLAPLWLPVYSIGVTVSQDEGRRKKRLRSTTAVNLYEALGGTFLGPPPRPFTAVDLDRRSALSPGLRDVKVHSALRKAYASYEKVSTEAAKERHAATLSELGVPTPCESLTIEDTALGYLPYYVGVLERAGSQRAVAVAGYSGNLWPAVSHLLTANLTRLRTDWMETP